MSFVLTLFLVINLGVATAAPSGSDEVQEMTVAAPRIQNSVEALLELRKQKNTVSDVLGQEAMARSGDSDAADRKSVV